jgi:hypothetical protein
MTDRTATTLLSGWIAPLEAHFRDNDLDLLVYGSFAGGQAEIRICLVDAHHHGFPVEPRDRITVTFGNWLELSGTFHASPVDNWDCNAGHTGYLTGVSATFSRRTLVDPWGRLPSNLARKTITAYFCGRIPWLI